MAAANTAEPAAAATTLPLAGLRVLEAGSSIAAAFCAKLLAAFGAEVVKVEPPEGDPIRQVGPFAGDRPSPEGSLLFLYLNTGKSSVTLDPASRTGALLLEKLIGSVDIVVETADHRDGGAAGGNGRTSPDERASGLDAAALAAGHPGLIVTTISDFGEIGPYAGYQAGELVLLALGGLLNMVGEPEREPLRLGGYQAAFVTALSAFTGTLTALHRRDETGEGQVVSVSAQECVAYTEWKSSVYYQAGGQVRVRGGREAQWVVLRARDGFLAFVYQDDHWPAIVELAGDERLNDERYATRAGRVAHREELRPILEKWTVQHTKLDLYHTLQARGVPVGPVADVPDLLASPQYAARGFFTSVDHPATGAIPYPGVPCTFDNARPPLTRAPHLGEHNQTIYGEWLRLGRSDLARLRERAVI